MNQTTKRLGERIAQALTPDLLSPTWAQRATLAHPMTGHCYVASEAAFHLLGGFDSPWRPRVLRMGDITHWWLTDGTKILDITRDQFTDPVPYELGRPCGFLTRQPSRRARIVMSRLESYS